MQPVSLPWRLGATLRHEANQILHELPAWWQNIGVLPDDATDALTSRAGSERHNRAC
ncbi:hypothetical protein METHB2_430027 [Candidatus Methylobacter favarea]|uniref:Uncharacterized protein n=1 Tax=Candidatus Methylobacter favarea TaxID=2707345 RepID=A0A8S0WJV4_9GAMM|nr:hypothetical protein METHB2_430027 [Candidatus Methylobacter favarea]